MSKLSFRVALFFWSLFLFSSITYAGNPTRGIYVTQWNFENTSFVNYLIKHAKAAGINTFVIDLEMIPSKRYQQNLQLLKENNIKYVARIIMFPDGGTPTVIKTPEIWQKKYRLVQQAVDWGAKEIQLDYIRYKSAQKASSDNSKDILAIIQWYKNKLAGQNIPLEIDVFGVTSFGESKHIGQNIKLFSQTVDAICPMVYPSHYWPFQKYSKIPYETVYDSLTRIKKQFGDPMPIKMYAYIELSNYHYPKMSRDARVTYIKAQLRAVQEAGADGWYAWSPHNRYENLFAILQNQKENKNNSDKEIAQLAQDEEAQDEPPLSTEELEEKAKAKKVVKKVVAAQTKIETKTTAKSVEKPATTSNKTVVKTEEKTASIPTKPMIQEQKQATDSPSSFLSWFYNLTQIKG